jgi:hypothetical protein
MRLACSSPVAFRAQAPPAADRPGGQHEKTSSTRSFRFSQCRCPTHPRQPKEPPYSPAVPVAARSVYNRVPSRRSRRTRPPGIPRRRRTMQPGHAEQPGGAVKALKIAGVAATVYLGLVLAFEAYLGIAQPQWASGDSAAWEGTIVLTTFDAEGNGQDRVRRADDERRPALRFRKPLAALPVQAHPGEPGHARDPRRQHRRLPGNTNFA